MATDDELEDVQDAFDAWLAAAKQGDDRRHKLLANLEAALKRFALDDPEPSVHDLQTSKTL